MAFLPDTVISFFFKINGYLSLNKPIVIRCKAATRENVVLQPSKPIHWADGLILLKYESRVRPVHFLILKFLDQRQAISSDYGSIVLETWGKLICTPQQLPNSWLYPHLACALPRIQLCCREPHYPNPSYILLENGRINGHCDPASRCRFQGRFDESESHTLGVRVIRRQSDYKT
jgi:hypothetical protein